MSKYGESNHHNQHQQDEQDRHQSEYRHGSAETPVVGRTLALFRQEYDDYSGNGRKEQRDDEGENETDLTASAEKTDDDRQKSAGEEAEDDKTERYHF